MTTPGKLNKLNHAEAPAGQLLERMVLPMDSKLKASTTVALLSGRARMGGASHDQ